MTDAVKTGPLKLTGLGEFVVAHGTMTSADWWKTQIREIEKLRDQDYGFDELMDERARGFAALAKLFHEHGSPENWPTRNKS